MTGKTHLLATTAVMFYLTASAVTAQSGPQPGGQLWGPPVSATDSSPVIRELGDQLGMVRSNQLFWQQLNALELTGNGSWVDLETSAPGEMQPVSKYTLAYSVQLPALRLDVEGPGFDRIVRVVRGDLDRAWDESRPGYPTGDAENAAFREQMLWFWPHAFARAAAYAEQGRCPDGSECAVEFSVIEDVAGNQVTVEIEGTIYSAVIGEDNRPARISARIDVPGVGEAEYIASYRNYRNGLGLGASGEEIGEGVRGLVAAGDVGAARGEGILDKFHTGAYFPGNVVHEVDGVPVLELEVTEGWPNAFVIFPTPEVLAAAQ